MHSLAVALCAIVAVLHLYFLTLEMFLWRTAYGRKIFGNTVEKANDTAVLAANQGLYNGFLVAGLVWGIAWPAQFRPVETFFLSCVIIAGLYGGLTASKRIIAVQALPAVLALVAVWWG